MIKFQELHDPNSCMSKAFDSEMTFVLLARDPSAPAAIRTWIQDRQSRFGDRHDTEEQLREAETCARIMEASQPFWNEMKQAKARGENL